MPRASNSGKRHTQGANGNHNNNPNGGGNGGSGSGKCDTRHENGLVGPSKRVAKQRSRNDLESGTARAANDHAAGPNASAIPPVPALPTSNGFVKQDDVAAERRTAAGGHRGSLGTYSESTSTDSLAMPNATGSASMATLALSEENHCHIDVNDAKNVNVHRDPGPLEIALNVLRSCPLQDTIAILIILMNVSPTALTWIYMLFTLLTFVVPPVTTSSGLSFTEIFDGNQGTPSLTTLICMDVVMLGIWLFLWAPMQQFILDLSQVVISLTLGGGGSSRQGVARNIFLCIAIVGATQWTRHMKLMRLSQVTALLGSNRFLSPDLDDPLEPPIRPFEKQGPYGWFRSIFAIHIVTQGLVRYIREWYLRREKRDQLSQSQLDPEAGKPSSFTETPSDAAPLSVDGDGSLPIAASPVSTKKRRKQSALVRIRQPLWAALASTKIVMVKEYELSHAASEFAGSNATDIHNLGNATFNTEPEQIWICYIGSGEVCFNTSHFVSAGQPEQDEEDRRTGVDRSKPFYVKVNNAVWQPTRIVPIEGGEEEEVLHGTRWTGDIYGLTPLSNYECEFISTETNQVIFSTSLRTIAAKIMDVDTSKAASGQRSRRRHDSPATTLRASINASEADLAEKKNRLKSARKEHNRKVAAVRKDIDKLTSAAQSAGGNDEKLRQKIAQNRNLKSQAEEACGELENEFKEYKTVPKALQSEHDSLKSEWNEEKKHFDQARAEFKSFKSTIDKEVKTLEDEESSLQARRNKIATRIAKADTDHARITDANKQGLNEAQRRLQERSNYENDMRTIESQYLTKIESMTVTNEQKQTQIMHMTTQIQAYLASFQSDGAYDQASPPMPYNSTASTWGPPNPAGHYQSGSLWPPTSMPTPAPSSLVSTTHPSPFPNPLQPAIGTPPQPKTRGRSSSMLSNVSGFTQSTDDEDSGNTAKGNAGVIGPPPGLGHGSQLQKQVHHLHSHNRGYPNATAPSGSTSGGMKPAAVTIRPPPGFGFGRQNSDDSGSGSGSAIGDGRPGSQSGSGSAGSGRSSLRSGSGSGGQSPI